jgi:DNA repair protein RecN (Recombination protein N)
LYIEKQNLRGRTATVLRNLTREERLSELVRMTAGTNNSRAARESAAELLQAAESVKLALRKKK